MDRRVRHLHRCARAIAWVALLCVFCPLDRAVAQSPKIRALKSIAVSETETGWTFELELDFPVRYLRHSPETATRVVRLQVAPLERGGDELPDGSQRETLPVPREQAGPLLDVFYDGSVPDNAVIELQFTRSLVFQVSQRNGLRRLTIEAQLPASSTAGAGEAKVSTMLIRARQAIRDGQIDLAIALLTRVLELPQADVPLEARMDARELLGLTHERQGQLAHAAAEYEAYLEEHAGGPAAERVRQRLEAIRTSGAAPGPALRKSPSAGGGAAGSGLEREAFGTLGARIYHTEARESTTGLRFAASDLLTDANVTGRLATEDWELRGDFAGTYDHNLEDSSSGRSDDIRISRLSSRIEDRVHGLEATLGRQRRSDGGVLGRFDGLHTAMRLGSTFRLGAVAGMPVARWADNAPDAHTWVFGGSVNFDDFLVEGFQGQIFVVGQRAWSMLDRTAVGGELRYTTDRTYSLVYFDYDVVFKTLNGLVASANWRATEHTDLRASFERRNAPVVTLQQALQGQTVSDLGDLKRLFSEREIRDLALDRAAVATTGTVGVTHRLGSRYQLSGDFAINHITGTKTSGGVPGAETNGPDFGTTLGLLVSDWLVENGVGSATVRYFEGQMYRSFMTLLYSRFTLPGSFRVAPKLRFELRSSKLQGERSRLRPSVELSWRRNHWALYGDAGGEWEEPLASGHGASRQLGFFSEAGVRWDF